MELAELVGLRPVPCAGLLVMLTQRCPLACAHCSTSSTPRGTDQDAADLLRFINSCGPTDRPELVLLTGGEPLLIPELVRELATSARAVGTRSALLSGMFFAREGRIPERVLRAITAVDHFSASIDAFHEREVARADVLRALATVLDAGIPVSLHITGTGPDDPYLADLTGEVRRTFGDTVPMLVNEVRAVGRAAAWADPARVTATATPGAAMESAGGPLPCAMAAWPVVAADGTVLACCNQETVDRRPPPPTCGSATSPWTTGRRCGNGPCAARRCGCCAPSVQPTCTPGSANRRTAPSAAPGTATAAAPWASIPRCWPVPPWPAPGRWASCSTSRPPARSRRPGRQRWCDASAARPTRTWWSCRRPG